MGTAHHSLVVQGALLPAGCKRLLIIALLKRSMMHTSSRYSHMRSLTRKPAGASVWG
jgi:hypothetical protein